MTTDIIAKFACVSEKNSSSREVTGNLCKGNKNQRNVSFLSAINDLVFRRTRNLFYLAATKEGPEGVKWRLGFGQIFTGKMGFRLLGVIIINKRIGTT